MTDPVFVALDLELTGLKVGSAEITEIGLVRCTPDEVLETWSTLVRPYTMPDLRIQRLTGISPEMLLEAPTFDEVVGQLREFLSEAIPIGHNVKFDLEHLGAAGVDASRAPLDTLPIAQVLDPTAPSHRLGDLCDRYGLVRTGAHRALADADASRLLLLALQRRWYQLSPSVHAQLAELIERAAPRSPLALFLSTVPAAIQEAPAQVFAAPQRRRPSRAPRVRVPDRPLVELSAAAFDAATADADSPLEARDEQRAMAVDVARAFEAGEVALVEAGTGVGKSLAYLVPAALLALQTGERVVISTHTRNLQQQLDEHDIPQLREMIERVAPGAGERLNTAVLKGRDNYLCRRSLDNERQRVRDPEAALVVARSLVWAQSSETGDREELRLPRVHDAAWQRLSAGEVSCLRDGCPYVENGTCFLAGAYERAEQADIIIVNHALLVSDLLTDQSIIPHAPYLIIDEAQFLEQVATDQLRIDLDEVSLRGLIKGVASGDARRSTTLARRATRFAADEVAPLLEAVTAADGAIDAAWSRFDSFSREHASAGNDLRVTDGARAQPAWSSLEERWLDAQRRVADLQQALGKLARACDDRAAALTDEQRDQAEMLAEEARDVSRALAESMVAAEATLTADADETIAWFERDQRSGELGLRSAPLSVGAALDELLWPRRKSVVLTGATLTVDNEWNFLREQLHVPEALESQYGSPFDYTNHARIFVPTDMPPVQGSAADYEAALAHAIPALARAAGGRTLALFTAHGTMRRVADRVQPLLEASDIALEVQGRNGSPAQVIGQLQEDPRTVAFGVNALWTGVDVPGDALSLLIVCRLPFGRPNDPIQVARSEQYDNAFIQLHVPSAILRMRQGIGRLIRTRSDRGVVVILDDRVSTKNYGHRFLDALPPAPVEHASVDQIARAVASFLPPLSDG